MPTITADEIVQQAEDLTTSSDRDEAVDKLISLAEGDRRLVEAARDKLAIRVHERVDDFQATAALTLLNRALSRMPRFDPLDWRVRWSKHRKP